MQNLPLLLLLVACTAFVLPSAALPPPPCLEACCQDICWNAYNAEVEDCVNKGDVTGLLTQPGQGQVLAQSIRHDMTSTYTGPTVDVSTTVEDKCKENIGYDKLNECLAKCLPPPPPPPLPANDCEDKCQKDYNAEVDDCVNKADVSGLLTPIVQDAASSAQYTGPQVDVLEEVKKKCKYNIGTAKKDACLAACKPCDKKCEDQYGAKTVGWLRCSKGCGSGAGRRLRRHSLY